jgi:hypothetical protein
MEIKLTIYQKLLLSFFFFSFSIAGFMIKLPFVFRHHDKELHSFFYFIAALFLNVLFVKRHLIIFCSLLLFGIAIEFAQEYSNKFFSRRIHGRFDKEDVFANFKGLILFTIVWFVVSFISYLFKKNHQSET